MEGRNPGECSDGADNDGNGDFDCNDAACKGSPDCADADTDTDTDTDTDRDSDTDTDTNTDTDTDTGNSQVDADGDGYTVADGDCDDGDATVNPAVAEVCDDGMDNDCDGTANQCVLGDRGLADADAEFTGEAANDRAGSAVAFAGDVNDDGYQDVLIGATGVDTDAGAAYLILGSVSPADRSLGAADAEFTGASRDYAGQTGDVAGVGDVNGDGFDDMMFGTWANNESSAFAGRACLLLGSPSPNSRPLAAADAIFSGVEDSEYASAVAGAGDVDGDGYQDMLVGGYGKSSDAGTAYLVFGSASPASGFLGVTTGVEFSGRPDDFAGNSVAGAGDVDGDGHDDLLVGAPGNSDGGYLAGSAYLVLGSVSLTSSSLAAADASLVGEAASDYAGTAVAGAGDVNNDGYEDVLVGAYFNSDAGAYAGAAYLVFGSVSPATQSLATADAKWVGEAAGDYAGGSVAAAGDVDDDGYHDILVGAAGSDDEFEGGAAYLILGSSSPTPGSLGTAEATFTGNVGDYAGWSVAGAGDMNGDGNPDVLLGAGANSDADLNAGAAFLILGSGP